MGGKFVDKLLGSAGYPIGEKALAQLIEHACVRMIQDRLTHSVSR